MQLKKYLIVIGLLLTASVFASEVEIVKVVLTKYTGTWRADVTLNHADTGWKHYADAWRLVDEKGNEMLNAPCTTLMSMSNLLLVLCMTFKFQKIKK